MAKPRTRTPPVPAATAPQASYPRFLAILALLLAGMAASMMLTLDHFGAMSLPGCGAGSGCAAAAKSEWAQVLGVPVAFVGLAYFLGALAAWVTAKGHAGWVFRWVAAIAAGASLVYLGIAAGAKLWCVYCVAVHAVNVLVLAVLALGRPVVQVRAGRSVVIGAGIGAAVLVVLLPIDALVTQRAKAAAEAALAESTAAMVQQGAGTNGTGAGQTVTTSSPEDGTQSGPSGASSSANSTTRALTGRYRSGPERAPVRIVMFTDYQCPDCFKIEEELRALMDSVPGLSVGIRYFPLSNKCNPAMGDTDLHPNACWAARAAETAGILKGPEGFWRMHRWLFEHKGSFTDAELAQGLAELGYDRAEFERVMQSPATAAAVKEDVERGQALGIYFTPMIFINGVELKGWNAPSAMTRAVQAVAAANPPAADHSADLPPDARERYFSDWREQPKIALPQRFTRHVIDPGDAAVDVLLIGDYQEKGTADADGLLRLFTQGPKPHIRYAFGQFPVDKACNPRTQMAIHDQACTAARAAEAAEVLGGQELFWKMHDWLMNHQNGVTDEGLRIACGDLEIDYQMLREAMEQPFIAEAIREDADAAAGLGIRSVPLIYINGRQVPRWKLNNENLLAGMIMEAAGQ